MNRTMDITVFTPTYNRAYRLKKLYQSLAEQTFKNFEWVIIDDGSIDETEDIVSSFQLENNIQIQYIKQENGGKHRAINKGLEFAKGALFFIVDSDDRLPFNALEIIIRNYDQIKNNTNVAGVVGRKAYFDKQKVGSQDKFDSLITDALSIRYKENLQGDLAEVFKTEILKTFVFPEISNEKFCPEALIWNRIAQKYKLLYFDESIYECEYLEDGLTAKITKIRMQSPKASMLHYAELEHYKIPWIQKVKANINFWRFSFTGTYTVFQNLNKVAILNSIFGLPLGFFMALNDKRKL
jgi:glycosyltransferase involved in cell wall biosynthesis